MTCLVMTPFLTTLILPCHGSVFFTHGGCVRPGGGLVFLKQATERLVDVRDVADDRDVPMLPSALLTICSGYWSWIACRFESSLTTPLFDDLVARPDASAAAPAGAPRRPAPFDFVQALDERPRGVVVVVDEPVGVVAAVEARVPACATTRLVGLRLLRLQARAGAEAADVRADDLRSDDLVGAEEREEQVARCAASA